MVSTVGDPNLRNPNTYCGSGPFTIQSTTNSIAIGEIKYSKNS